MDKSDLRDAQIAHSTRLRGNSTGAGHMGYTPEWERSLSALPTWPNPAPPLQSADGKFAFAIDPFGTGARIPGRYYIDSLGRMKPY